MTIRLKEEDDARNDDKHCNKRCDQKERSGHQIEILAHFYFLLFVHQAAIRSGMKKKMK